MQEVIVVAKSAAHHTKRHRAAKQLVEEIQLKRHIHGPHLAKSWQISRRGTATYRRAGRHQPHCLACYAAAA